MNNGKNSTTQVRQLSSFADDHWCDKTFAIIHSTPHILLGDSPLLDFHLNIALPLVYSRDVCSTTYEKVY